MTPVRLTLFAFLAVVNLLVFAQQQRQAAAQQIRPLPSPVVTQYDRIQRLLPLATKQKIDGLVPTFSEEAMRLPLQTDFEKLAASHISKDFPGLSPQQTDVLVFALLEQTAESMKGKIDGMNEMSEMASLRLQMMMDRRSKFISTLSNIMKKISTTQDSLVENLK